MGSRNCKPWPFELHWRGRLDLGIKLMADLQDFWLRSEGVFPSRRVVAVLIRIFHYYPSSEDWSRSPNDWLSLVGTAESECEQLCPKLTHALMAEAIEHLCSIVSEAAESWENRSITNPPTDSVVRDLLDQLSRDGLVKLYYA